MNSKGFTLMEVLAVLLILAVVVTFALPGIRLVRDEVRYGQAKNAAIKMADAMRVFYQDSKGYRPVGVLKGKLEADDNDSVENPVSVVTAAQGSCDHAGYNGVPSSGTSGGTLHAALAQLFACDYLSTKDFVGLPYQFVANDGLFNADPSILVVAVGTEAAGPRHAGDSWCVYRDSSVSECEVSL